MSLRSPAILGAGPHHPIHLLMDDSDTQTHIANMSVSHTHIHMHACTQTGSARTHMIMIHTKGYAHRHTHMTDGHGKFQRRSACPYLVSVVIATPGLIPCSKTHRASFSFLFHLVFFFPVCLLIFFSISLMLSNSC